MKLWFDEDLSPTLVNLANSLGLHATCNRDRGLLNATDRELRVAAHDEDYVIVTDNARDYRPLCRREQLHPGLIIVPADHGLLAQRQLTEAVVAWINDRSSASGLEARDFMVNKVVEIDDAGTCSAEDLPRSG
jgi:predicted nuclease of predicted toxin-antitoxin system